MRGKRSKQYRKLMHQYGLAYGFREPYQVLMDADIVKDAERFKMDLVGGLERTLHGKIKPMITQCCMRHLYACNKEPGVAALIERAKTYERRRCGHLPEEYPEPLSALECLKSVVDPKGSGHNKNRYVVASQEQPVRKAMRGVLGVPLVYINRSVMIMEPMAGASAENRDKAEKQKFREGLKGRESGSQTMKRKRTDEDGEGAQEQDAEAGDATPKKKKTHQKGPKGPNPLAVKKAKKPIQEGTAKPPQKPSSTAPDAKPDGEGEQDEAGAKRKRRRKHKSGVGEAAGGEVGQLNEANGEE